VTFILLGTRKWFTQPISQLIEATKELAKGNLHLQMEWKRRDELSELGQAFNQMALELSEAHKKIIQEADRRLELERTLRHSEKLATVGQLASGLAHEIGTPLNIITGRIELTRKRIKDAEVQKNLEVVTEQTDRITKIIRQLLGYVRKKKISQTGINVNDLLDTTLRFLDYQILKQDVEVVKDFPKDLPQVYGDRDQLQQVFLNLLINSLQAMPRGGTLQLSTSLKEISKEGIEGNKKSYLEIEVEDSGVGMKREVLENIFNPFFTTKDSGSGLGLMVTQGIVQDHEGWIEVESEVGKGSRFKVYLPAYEGEE
jgi:signal transduction histidine kinase